MSITMMKLTPSGLTLIASPLSKSISEKTQQRHDKYKHILYTDFPDIRTVDSRVYWGIYSWTLTKARRRWLWKHSALSIDGLTLTPSDVVRDYLDFYHPKRLRATGLEVREYESHRAAPLHVHPCIMRDAVYIDIKSTYFSIVKAIGWGVNYYPGAWLTPSRAPLDFPLPDNKPARNYLTSIGLPGAMSVWTGHKWIFQKAQNLHINLGLWSVTVDILHSIACQAVALGARYVHTDGYILPAEKGNELMQIIRRYNLTPEVRAEGEAAIFGFGNYIVGTKQTKNFLKLTPTQKWSNLYRVNSGWLEGAIDSIVQRDIPRILYERSLSE